MRQARSLLALTLLASSIAAGAAELHVADGIDAKLDSTVSFGTILRTNAPDPAEYAYIPSTTVNGATPGQLTGQTGGSDLNFAKNKPVSTLLQGMFDLSVKGQTLGLFVRAAAWHDFTLGQQSAAYGNYPNGFAPGATLSDQGWQTAAKFDGAMIRDAWVSTSLAAGSDSKLELRLGEQVLNWDGDQSVLSGNWGGARMISGGINSAINPNDFVAQLRPGALPEESRVPVGMLSLHLVSGKQWGLDAFVPYETKSAVLPGCGSFFDVVSVIPPGCNLGSAIPYPFPGTNVASVAALTERSLLGNGLYVHRYGDDMASARGQFGVAGHWVFAPANTELSAYVLNTPTSMPFFEVKVDDINGAPVAINLAPYAAALHMSAAQAAQAGVIYSALQRLNPTVAQLPAALAPLNLYTPPAAGAGNGFEYAITYPGSVRLYGLSFKSDLSPATRLFGEVAYRANQPISLNLNDVLNAFLLRMPNSLLNERKNILSLPAGSVFDAYDRVGIKTASFGIDHRFDKVLGASQARLAFEVGLSHVDGLEDPMQMRYGRAFAYGSAPYLDSSTGQLSNCPQPATGAGLYYAPGKTCTGDGFITGTAWGWRLNASASYPHALWGATLTPSLTVADDVSGYSYDGSFSAGRVAIRPALRADWGRSYYAQLAYTHLGGGRYNLMADRSNLMLAAGLRF